MLFGLLLPLSTLATQNEQLRKPIAPRLEVAFATSSPLTPHTAAVPKQYELLADANIQPEDWRFADFIVMAEGHYDPCVRNGNVTDCSYALKGGRKAYGVCQALPGSKMAVTGSDWATNPITQLKWCDAYAKATYGGWEGAYYAWTKQGWW